MLEEIFIQKRILSSYERKKKLDNKIEVLWNYKNSKVYTCTWFEHK